jgi:hypothetical protein
MILRVPPLTGCLAVGLGEEVTWVEVVDWVVAGAEVAVVEVPGVAVVVDFGGAELLVVVPDEQAETRRAVINTRAEQTAKIFLIAFSLY